MATIGIDATALSTKASGGIGTSQYQTMRALAVLDCPHRFLLYAAGTWVKGGTDVITLDTIYDSVLLGQNDYIALFSEEGWLVAQRCPDSRVVSVGVCPDGATAAGVDIACDGSAVPAG